MVRLPRKESFVWESYTYRHYNDKSVESFKAWVVNHDWQEVLEAEGSDLKAEAYQRTIDSAIEAFFPLKMNRRKNTDLPWMSKRILQEIDTRKRIYVEDGGQRTVRWREQKAKTDKLIRERKSVFLDTQKEHILAEDANRNFFKHVKKN